MNAVVFSTPVFSAVAKFRGIERNMKNTTTREVSPTTNLELIAII